MTGTQPEHARTSALERRFSGSSSRRAEPKYYTQLETAQARRGEFARPQAFAFQLRNSTTPVERL